MAINNPTHIARGTDLDSPASAVPQRYGIGGTPAALMRPIANSAAVPAGMRQGIQAAARGIEHVGQQHETALNPVATTVPRLPTQIVRPTANSGSGRALGYGQTWDVPRRPAASPSPAFKGVMSDAAIAATRTPVIERPAAPQVDRVQVFSDGTGSIERTMTQGQIDRLSSGDRVTVASPPPTHRASIPGESAVNFPGEAQVMRTGGIDRPATPPRAFANEGTGAMANQGSGTLDNAGTGTLDNRGTGTLDNQGSGTLANRGSGTLDNAGSGVLDNQGSGTLANTGSGTLDNAGSGVLANQGSGWMQGRGTGTFDANERLPQIQRPQAAMGGTKSQFSQPTGEGRAAQLGAAHDLEAFASGNMQSALGRASRNLMMKMQYGSPAEQAAAQAAFGQAVGQIADGAAHGGRVEETRLQENSATQRTGMTSATDLARERMANRTALQQTRMQRPPPQRPQILLADGTLGLLGPDGMVQTARTEDGRPAKAAQTRPRRSIGAGESRLLNNLVNTRLGIDPQTGLMVDPDNPRSMRAPTAEEFQGAMDFARGQLDSIANGDASAGYSAGPSDAAVEYLRQNPHARADFDAKYGAGSATQILGS